MLQMCFTVQGTRAARGRHVAARQAEPGTRSHSIAAGGINPTPKRPMEQNRHSRDSLMAFPEGPPRRSLRER